MHRLFVVCCTSISRTVALMNSKICLDRPCRRYPLVDDKTLQYQRSLLHLNQKTEYDPSLLRMRRWVPSAVCFLPKGSVSSIVSFSEIGPISCFDTGMGGLNRLGSGCRMAKMLLFDRPIIRRWTSCKWSYRGQSVSRYRAATGSHGLHGSSMSMHDLAYVRSASTPSV